MRSHIERQEAGGSGLLALDQSCPGVLGRDRDRADGHRGYRGPAAERSARTGQPMGTTLAALAVLRGQGWIGRGPTWGAVPGQLCPFSGGTSDQAESRRGTGGADFGGRLRSAVTGP
ncbi:MAG: hypothetical protein ACRDTE_29165 [Pseudonocardiaceae bacterium]